MRVGQAPDAKPGDKKAFDEGFARLTKELKANMSGAAKKQATGVRSRKSVVVAKAAALDCAAMHTAM